MRKTDRKRYRRLAQILKERRQQLGLTQAEVAERAQLGQPWVSDMERHERIADLFDYVRLAKALEMSAAQAFTLVQNLVGDPVLDGPPAPKPPPRKTKGRPRREEWD